QPAWMDKPLIQPEQSTPQDAVRRLALLCDIPVAPAELEAALPRWEILTTGNPAAANEFARSYETAAVALWEALQRPKRAAGNGEQALALQTVAPAEAQGRIYAGLHGLVKSAQHEDPHLRGQFIALEVGSGIDAASLALRRQAEAGQ